MKFGVLVFPGSNCDHDAYWVVSQVAQQPVTLLWHESHDLENCDAIIVPGGFAYGDYLRTGAIARFAPVMEAVRKFAHGGGLVIGICNGFQILCESRLLPARQPGTCSAPSCRAPARRAAACSIGAEASASIPLSRTWRSTRSSHGE